MREMEQLVDDSRVMSQGTPYYINLFRKTGGVNWVRWRLIQPRKHIHITWDRMLPQVMGLGDAKKAWMFEANWRARLLNTQEGSIRKSLAAGQKLMREFEKAKIMPE